MDARMFWAVPAILVGCIQSSGNHELTLEAPTSAQSAVKPTDRPVVEEVYTWLSIRVGSAPGNTALCQEAPFDSDVEGHFELWAYQLHPTTAQVIRTKTQQVGFLKLCFGITRFPTIDMYGKGTAVGLPVTVLGEGYDLTGVIGGPESGISISNFWADGFDLPPGYVGSFFSTSGLIPSKEGYHSDSFVTWRVWREAN